MDFHDDGLPVAHDDLPPVTIDRSLVLTRPVTIKACGYWMRLRGERAMPMRKDVVPRDMREFIAHVGLVDVLPRADGAFDYAIRLAGEKIMQVYGPITGRPVSEFLEPRIAARWVRVWDEVRSHALPLAVSGRVAHGGKRYLKYELFTAPLGQDHSVTHIFGVLDFWPVA